MKPVLPDLGEPFLTPRRIRRIVVWVLVLSALVAFCVYLQSVPFDMFHGAK